MIAGIDFSTKAVDVVLLDEDTDAATWHRFALPGDDAFIRTRHVPMVVPTAHSTFWDDVLAIGIEEPAGRLTGRMFRVQGAVLACLPRATLVKTLMPSEWRKTVGLPGNAPKVDVWVYALRRMWDAGMRAGEGDAWPEDATDAYCIALATRTLLQRDEAA